MEGAQALKLLTRFFSGLFGPEYHLPVSIISSAGVNGVGWMKPTYITVIGIASAQYMLPLTSEVGRVLSIFRCLPEPIMCLSTYFIVASVSVRDSAF